MMKIPPQAPASPEVSPARPGARRAPIISSPAAPPTPADGLIDAIAMETRSAAVLGRIYSLNQMSAAAMAAQNTAPEFDREY